jgi:hypothetical protein
MNFSRQRWSLVVLVACALAVLAFVFGDRLFGGHDAGEDTPAADADPPRPRPEIDVTLEDGRYVSRLYRRGPIAAHVEVRTGEAPRVVIAFPAGASGVGVLFDGSAPLEIAGPIEEIVGEDKGVAVPIRASAERLVVADAVTGSLRFLRDALIHRVSIPAHARSDLEIGDDGVTWSRARADGGARYSLHLDPADDTRVREEQGRVIVESSSGAIAFELRGTSSEPALTPLPIDRVVNERAGDDPRARDALAFLSYEEKLLAGSWRYLTYFGRDTLLSVLLLMDVLEPDAIEAGLRSVIERLAPNGDVAHEEDIGDFAAARRRTSADPFFDYKMIDDDFLLAPAAARYLLDGGSPRRAREFLAERAPDGKTFEEKLRTNVALVLERARPYGAEQTVGNLVALPAGQPTGEWRDSEVGLGNGRIPYDVNAALVPAALDAAQRLCAGVLADEECATEAARLLTPWRGAHAHFEVRVPAERARELVGTLAAERGIDSTAALASIDGEIVFSAVSLDATGVPLPIMNSDEGFALFFTDPSPERLRAIASTYERPFPAGLMTPAGIVVANPAYSDSADLRALFTTDHYHGTVVWSWQQALARAGMKRTLARTDLDTDTRARLERADAAIARAIEESRAFGTGELWTLRIASGGIDRFPFGAGAQHHTESNAAQLWSTVFLAGL